MFKTKCKNTKIFYQDQGRSVNQKVTFSGKINRVLIWNKSYHGILPQPNCLIHLPKILIFNGLILKTRGVKQLSMNKISKVSLISYPTFCSLACLVFPRMTLRRFLSTGSYQNALIQLIGSMLLGLDTLVILNVFSSGNRFMRQAIVARVVIFSGMLVTYFSSGERMLLVLIVIVGKGRVLSALGLRPEGER